VEHEEVTAAIFVSVDCVVERERVDFWQVVFIV
jgi:hypothetical protein